MYFLPAPDLLYLSDIERKERGKRLKTNDFIPKPPRPCSVRSSTTWPVLLLSLLTGCLGTNDLSGERLADGSIYDYRSPVGTSSQALLSDRSFKQLVIEVQPVGDAIPTQEALNRLQLFLAKYLNKPRGIGFQINPPLRATGKAAFTLDEVRQLETSARKLFTQKDRVAAYVLFVDGASSDDTPTMRTLGHAFGNTSIVVYHRTAQQLSGASNQPLRQVFEANLLMHEFGHVLGLVNSGAPDQSRHEDPAAPRHCSNPGCAMHTSAERLDSGSPNAQGVILDLDAACRQDLQTQGGR